MRLLQMYLPPTKNFIHAAVQHIRQAMPRVGVTMDTRLFVSALATDEELRQLWKAGPALLRPDAGAALDAAAAAVPADTGAAAQATSGVREDGERAPPGGVARPWPVASSNPALGRHFWARRCWGRPGRRAAFCRSRLGPTWSLLGTSGRWGRAGLASLNGVPLEFQD